MEQTVVGVFDSVTDAQRARDELVASGFSDTQVRLQAHAENAPMERNRGESARSAADGEGEGFMAGVSRFFHDLFGTEDDHAGHYAEAVRRGGSVVTVTLQDDSQVSQARTVLSNAGAVDIEKRAAGWREQGYAKFDPTAKPFDAEQVAAERERVIPVVREELEVGKREVDLGSVRVHSRIVTTPVQQDVQLREEHAQVERRAVDRPVTEGDLTAFKEGTIEIRESAERAVVGKSARVVEEVVVGTRSSTTTQSVNETLRNTEVEVEHSGGAGADGRAGTTPSADGQGYRQHYESNLSSGGGSYQDYEPSYRYGAQLRSDTRQADRSWDDLENDARTDWATRNPGSDWTQHSTAVRHGWETGKTGS